MTHGLRDCVMSPIRRSRRLHYFLRNLLFAPAEQGKAILAQHKCATHSLPIVMIVGCPRSGTSFTARMLNSAGLELPGEHTKPDAFNPEGYFEEDRIVSINSDILWGSNGHWFLPPRELRVYTYQRAQIVQVLSWLAGFARVCGWKDPRGTLTLPVWLDVARQRNIPVRVVGVFRHPISVARSVVRHEQGLFDFAQALNAWSIHNARLLELAARIPDRFYWFAIDQPQQRVEANLNAIAARLGLAARVSIDRKPHGADGDAGLSDVSAQVCDIYGRLLAAHAAQWHELCAAIEPA